MDDAALRILAIRLRAELDTVVTDPVERDRIRGELDTALGAEPLARDALLDAVNGHESTRSWFAGHAPVREDVDRSFELLPGDPEDVPIYYVCPEGDEDAVFDVRPPRPPRCTTHRVEMVTED